MKNMKITAALLAGMLVFAGCGQNGGGETAASADSSVSTSAASEAAEESVEEDAAETADEKEEDKEETTEEKTEESVSVSEEDADGAEEEADDAAEESYDSSELLDIPTAATGDDLSKYIKLAEYKGLEVELEKTEVTDEDVDMYMQYYVEPVEIEDKTRAVKDGDIVNLDFVGKKDGVEFSGGTGTDYDLEIGSGTFIPGFEEGMIGMKIGEEKDLELTFPDNYGSEELAGQDVVFTVTVNTIKEMPELTDKWAEEFSDGEYKTLDEFRESIRSDIEEQDKYYAEQNAKSELWQQITDNSEIIAFPEDYITKGYDSAKEYFTQTAESYGMSLDEYCEEYLIQMGYNAADTEEVLQISAREEAKNRLIYNAIIEAEGMSSEDQEYKDMLDVIAGEQGMKGDELVAKYGEDMVSEYIFSELIMDRVLSYAKVTYG